MGDLIDRPEDGLSRWSINRLSREFGMSRNTISLRIEQCGVQPGGVRNGSPVYRLRDLVPALFASNQGPMPGSEGFNPEKLAPKDRRDYFASELDRIKTYQMAGRLCPDHEVEREMAKLIAPTVQALECLPDILERDAALSPEQVELVQSICDHERQRLYEEMIK